MRQVLRSEIRDALYQNLTVPKDWPTFFKAVAQAESSIYLEHKSSSHAGKPTHNKEKPISKSTDNGHSFNSHDTYTATIACGNSQAHSQGCKGRGSCGGRNSHGGHRGRRVSNGTPASGANNINKSNPSNHSKHTCFNCNKVGQ